VTTITLQAAAALALLLLAAGAIWVARSIPESGAHRQSWVVTGGFLGVIAAVNAFQVSFATLAFLRPGSRLFELYLRFAPVGNHSRTLLLIALYVALAWVALRRPAEHPLPRFLWAALGGILILGGAVGIAEGSLNVAKHFAATAIVDSISLLLLGGVLILAMQRDSMDRILWTVLAAHGFLSVLGVLHLAAMSLFGTPGSWTPPAWQVHAVRVVLLLVQVGLVLERIRLLRRATPVPGLLPALTSQRRLGLG
jgi:hypothetical protein